MNNTETLATLEKTIDGFTVKYSLEAYYDGFLGMANFQDQRERTNNHIGGVTVQSDDGENWIPLQYSISQLTKDYAKQGKENPPKEAYQSLKDQFDRDSQAFEVNVIVQVLKNDIELFEDAIIGSGYDYSDFDYDHDKALETFLIDYSEENLYIENARNTLKQLLEA